MSHPSKNTSIQAFFPPTPSTSPNKSCQPSSSQTIGDGFTDAELQVIPKCGPAEQWHPQAEYHEREIRDLQPGPQAVTFMGRVANIFEVANSPKTPRSAKGCVKLCVKDEGGAVTVRVWFADRCPKVVLGSLVSVWTNHISNGQSSSLSSMSAPLFASLFPERDRSCHLMVHESSDDGAMYKRPLGYREGRPLSNLMTLQNFADGGHEVIDARILVVVKSIGQRKKIERKDGSVTENMNIQVHDDTAEATLGFWGMICASPGGLPRSIEPTETESPPESRNPWKPGETVLLLQAPACKPGRTTYLNLTHTTIIDMDPAIKDADWLRTWALRQRSKEALNPPFPRRVFDLDIVRTGPIRCLYTLAELDEFARAAPRETFQGYLSVLVMEVKLLENRSRQMLLCGECCSMPVYANAFEGKCRGCDGKVALRLNPKLLGQVIDETGAVAGGKLLLSDLAWRELLGRTPDELLNMGYDAMKYLADRLLFCRFTFVFGWTGDESKAGGRICVMSVLAD